MKNITIRLNETTIKAAENTYGAKVTGAQKAVEGFFAIQRRTLYSIGRRFSKNELLAIMDNLNGLMPNPDMMCSGPILAHHLLDGNTYEGLFQKWSIDPDDFIERVTALQPSEAFFLQDAIYRAWQEPDPLNAILNFIEPA